MRHVLYALFQVPGAAEAALQDLATAGLAEDEYHVFVQKNKLSQDLRSSESDGRRGLFIGLITGAVAGAIMGWLLSGPLGLLRLPLGSAIGFLMFLGIIVGMLGGGLSGAGLIHRNLQRLAGASQLGQTVITAETESLRSQEIVDRIFKKHGAIEASG